MSLPCSGMNLVGVESLDWGGVEKGQLKGVECRMENAQGVGTN